MGTLCGRLLGSPLMSHDDSRAVRCLSRASSTLRLRQPCACGDSSVTFKAVSTPRHTNSRHPSFPRGLAWGRTRKARRPGEVAPYRYPPWCTRHARRAQRCAAIRDRMLATSRVRSVACSRPYVYRAGRPSLLARQRVRDARGGLRRP